MKAISRHLCLFLLPVLACSFMAGQISSFKHVVIIFQENRTPDNLFQGLCAPPYGTSASCSTVPTGKQYNIQTKDWFDKTSSTGVTQPLPVALANDYDLSHMHSGFVAQCDKDSTGKCRMDGSAKVACFPSN